MDLWNTPRNRLLCAEPLEDRHLLSASAAAVDPEGDDDAGGAPVATSDLPDEVLAALSARFPGARLLEAELSTDDGEPLYEVLAEAEGGALEVTLTPRGGIVETEFAEPQNVPPPPVPLVTDAPAPAPPPAAPTVELLELEKASEDEDDGVQVAPSVLPRKVLAGLNAHFPGARIVRAEFGIDEGEPEFDVSAVFNGREIGVTLTPRGEVIETEQAVGSLELPEAVLEWVRQTFGDAEIREAAVVSEDGVLAYEVLLPAPGGGEVEAKLHLPGAPPPEGFTEVGDDAGGRSDAESGPVVRLVAPDFETSEDAAALAEPARTEAFASSQPGRPDEQPADRSSPPDQTPPQEGEAVAPGDRATAGEAFGGRVDGQDGGFATQDIAIAVAPAVAGALEALAAGSAPLAMLPELAGLARGVLPVDVAAVERGLAELLERVDALAQRALDSGDADSHAGAVRLALVAGLLAGAQLLLLDARRRRGGPVLVFNGGDSSWGWVLGTATTVRRRKGDTSCRTDP